MSINDNKAIANQFAQVWAAGCLHIVDELAAPDLVVSYPIPPEPIRGPEAFKAFLTKLIAGGKVVEETGIGNTLGLMQQIGAGAASEQT